MLQDVYKEQLRDLQTDNSGDVKTVSDEALPVSGMFTTALNIAIESYDALLGRHFLIGNGAVINQQRNTLQLDGKRDDRYPERRLSKGLTYDQSPGKPHRRE